MTCEHCARRAAEIDQLTEEVRQLKAEIYGTGGWRVSPGWDLRGGPARILECLVRHAGRHVPRQLLFEATRRYDDPTCTVEVKIVDVFVSRLRRWLEAYDIEVRTVWGVGYYLDPAMRDRLLALPRWPDAEHQDQAA